MDGEKPVAIQRTPHPTHSDKTLGAMEVERTVKRITFTASELKTVRHFTSTCPS